MRGYAAKAAKHCKLTAFGCAFGSFERVNFGGSSGLGLDVGGKIAAAAGPFIGRIGGVLRSDDGEWS